MTLVAAYIHIPFCVNRCGYCDFNSYAGLQTLIPAYISAVCREIEMLTPHISNDITVGTIYFGGGTPSILPIRELKKIISVFNLNLDLEPMLEISLEANPGTITQHYLYQLRDLGVNRISLGMQSANDEELRLLGRLHNFGDVKRANEWSRQAGFSNINLDLIYGLPDQNLKSWMDNLEAALSLKPDHLSLYALTLEQNTPMGRQLRSGVITELDQDLVADMYEAASERLETEGYHQYEISNWARINQSNDLYTCKHNIQYWRNLPYLGLGAGAHGYINSFRTINVMTPSEYINKINHNPSNAEFDVFPRTPATIEMNFIDRETEIGETMMLGLRLVKEGISEVRFQERFGLSIEQRFSTQINRLTTLGLLEWADNEGKTLRISKNGRLLGNRVFGEFIQ